MTTIADRRRSSLRSAAACLLVDIRNAQLFAIETLDRVEARLESWVVRNKCGEFGPDSLPPYDENYPDAE